MSPRSQFALLLMGLEVGLFLLGRFRRDKRFSWAPYDEITEYEVTLLRDGRPLPTADARRMLRISPRGRENRSLGDLISHLETWIERKGDDCDVHVRYRVNGGPEQVRLITGREN
jgi:hypothetical protein